MILRGAVDPIPIPDFSFLFADEAPSPLLGPLRIAVLVCVVLAVIGTVWTLVGMPPLRVPLATVALIVGSLALALAAIRVDVAHEAKLEEAAPVTLGRLLAVEEKVGELLEEYYGIEFYRMPSIPERGEEPQFGLVDAPDGVKLCWVHTVEAEDRLAVSCGTHDAATSTELPAAGM